MNPLEQAWEKRRSMALTYLVAFMGFYLLSMIAGASKLYVGLDRPYVVVALYAFDVIVDVAALVFGALALWQVNKMRKGE